MMIYYDLYLSLGSNLGDRYSNIDYAIGKLNENFGLYSAISDMIETQPWGHTAGGNFINCAVLYRIPDAGQSALVHSHSVLRVVKQIENELGRYSKAEYDDKGERIYRERKIDIDILFYGKELIDTEQLVIPHKMISVRDFVLVPLKQIADDNLKSSFPEIFALK